MDKASFIDMLTNSKTKFDIHKDNVELTIYRHGLPTAETIIQIENTDNKFNASNYCYSYWIFDNNSQLLGVYHYEC